MHGVPERVLLRHLLAESGGSRSEAARRAGVGRSTLYRWIEAGLLDEPVEAIQARYHPRPPSRAISIPTSR
jgi:transposase-like protein